jgi:hypothetical protein
MKTVTRRTFASGIVLLPSLRLSAANAQTGTAPAEARAIAKEAYIYGFPLVDKGPFRMYLRLYSPKAEVLDGTWTKPPLRRVG